MYTLVTTKVEHIDVDAMIYLSQGGYVFAFMCLSVGRIMQKVVDGFC